MLSFTNEIKWESEQWKKWLQFQVQLRNIRINLRYIITAGCLLFLA